MHANFLTVSALVVLMLLIACGALATPGPPASPITEQEIQGTVAAAVEATITALSTPNPTLTSVLPPNGVPTPIVASFPFTWEEGGEVPKEGGKWPESIYLDAVAITVLDFTREGSSQRIPGYVLYVVPYSVRYTLYKEWSGFGGFRAVVGPALEVVTDKRHTYGMNSQSIGVYHLSNFIPGEEKKGVLTFDIAPDESPVELRSYQDGQIQHVWKLTHR